MSNNRPIQIAVSGKSGCGNSSVSKELSKHFGVRLINYTFHSIADEMGIPFDEFCQMAEQDNQWDFKVDDRQIGLAKSGPCILGSRLAIWLWKESPLKVYLEATPEVRAGRIHNREGGDYTTVLIKTQARDNRDHDRFFRLYGIDNDNLDVADLVIDVNSKSIQEIVNMIVTHWNQMKPELTL